MIGFDFLGLVEANFLGDSNSFAGDIGRAAAAKVSFLSGDRCVGALIFEG